MPPDASAEDDHHNGTRRSATTITVATAVTSPAAITAKSGGAITAAKASSPRAADPHESLIKANVIVGISLGVAAVVLLAAGLGCFLHRRSRRPRRAPTLDSIDEPVIETVHGTALVTPFPFPLGQRTEVGLLPQEAVGEARRTTAVTLHARERAVGYAEAGAGVPREEGVGHEEEGPASVGEKAIEAASRGQDGVSRGEDGVQRRRTVVAVDAGPILLPPTYNPDWSRST